MAQLSWKKSLIKKAHTFMDFVVGWRGFYATVNAANKESRGTWAVPQKLTECPAQDDPINSIIELYYNLPFMHGRNNSPLRYRYPANNSTYEFLQQFNEAGGLYNQTVKIDYRHSLPKNWGPNDAGIGVSGVYSNIIGYGTDLGLIDVNGYTVWRNLNYDWSSNENVKKICEGSPLVNNNYGQSVITETPFMNNGNELNTLWVVPPYRQTYGRLLDSKQSAFKSKNTFSFYVWTGAIDPSTPPMEPLATVTCNGISGGKLFTNSDTFNVGKMAFILQTTSSSKTNDWTQTSKGTTKSYLTIDLINQTHDFYALETETIERQQFNVVNNVQFEKCPNNYTRVSIFYSQKETAAEALRYTRISWYAATIETSAKSIYTNLRDRNILSGQIFREKYLIMYGQQLENSTRIDPNKYNPEHVHNDYLPAPTAATVSVSLTQLALPNLVISGSVPESNLRCKTLYFSMWVDNQKAIPGKTGSGGYNNGGSTFCTIRNSYYDPTGTLMDTSTQMIRAGAIGQPGATSEQQKTSNYIVDLVEPSAFGVYEDLVEGLDIVTLTYGINKFAFNTDSNKIFINGKAYTTDQPGYNAQFIRAISFNGKRQDYILEWGTWADSLENDLLLQLTNA